MFKKVEESMGMLRREPNQTSRDEKYTEWNLQQIRQYRLVV